MAKTRIAPATKKLQGKTVVLLGKFGYGKSDRDAIAALVAEEGGTVLAGDKIAPDYVVEGTGAAGNPPAGVAKLQKKFPQVQVLTQAGFYQLVNPTADEFRQIILSGRNDHEYWHDMQGRMSSAGVKLDLTESDFRNRSVRGTLYGACLDRSDFRGAKLATYIDKVCDATFDGATFQEGSFYNAEDCSLKNVMMNNTRWNPATFVRCDFTGATLKIETGSYTTTTECIFKKADLRKADLGQSKFTFADFRGANLSDASLEKCDFTGANLSGADLSRADLRHARFINANLTKARFAGAILSGADLSGATIDGADFKDANVTGANLQGLDLSTARHLESKAARTAGPRMLELFKAAKASKHFATSIELELGKDEYVSLHPSLRTYTGKAYAGANYSHQHPKHSRGSYVDAPSFAQGMLNLTDLWSKGTPRFDTVKVDAKQCPLRGKELKDLAIAAWHEACGLDVPSADELERKAQQTASESSSLRDLMIAELEGGGAGVKKWNARSDKERQKLGKLRKHDFAKAKLAGVCLSDQDLEGSSFEGASLRHAEFYNARLKGANFSKANLRGANLARCKPSDVSFQGAMVAGCNLRAANFLRCNFCNADLTNSDFSFSDLGAADFREATLAKVTFFRTKFNEKTQFPPDFLPPEGLEWTGIGPRPGTPAPPPPPTSGTLDFEAFLAHLTHNVELARMQKAGSMLKAERFQLFFEANDHAIVGVVKSQSNKELVYSCRLGSDGRFGCCTQNLRPCGGLRGALCKHLLVLIVGLAKAGELDAATVNHWIGLSKSQKPAIDEEAMSATFLRYKGAEAGEIDWRPAETIPEDFYAM